MCRRIATVILVFFVVILAAVGLLVYDITRRAGPSPAASRTASPEAQRQAEKSAERVVRRLRDNYRRQNRKRAPAAPRVVDMELTEAELNELIRGLPQVRKTLSAQRLRDLEVDLSPEHLTASTRVPVAGGIEARVSATTRLWAEEGQLRYELTDARIGSLPAPGNARAALDKQLSATIRQLNKDFRGRIEEVTLTEDRLLLRGEVRPPS